MKDPIFKAENIATALEDAGIPPAEAEEILNVLRHGKWSKATQLMQMQGSRLVADVHAKQNNLYCLDYLLLKIKEAQEANQKNRKGSITMILNETFTLANSIQIPRLGLGTWMIEDDRAAQAVRDAVQIGYRHFDTAQSYENEQGVGEGIRTCGVAREALFVTTKMDAFIKTYEGAKAGIDSSLSALGLDYIDLLIIHSPQPWTDFRSDEHYFQENLEVWRAMEEAYQAGKLRAIGVSNFEQADLDNLLEHGTVKPMVNQVLAHVSNTPFELIRYCQEKDILVEAYSPVGHGEMLKNKAVAEMATRYGVTISQICIRYCLELGMLPLPKTADPLHMKENVQVDFSIQEADMETLKRIAPIKDYGEFSQFPVYGGKMHQDGSYEPQGK